MMKKIFYIIKKIPLLSIVLCFGIFARLIGAVTLVLPGGDEYHFNEAPMYAAALDRIRDMTEDYEASQMQVATKTVEVKKTEAVKPVKKKLTPQEKLDLIKGYISVKKEAVIRKQQFSEAKKARLASSNGTYIFAHEYPAKALIRPARAKDYGMADGTYTDPPGTTYEYINEGIFAQNNDYYSFQAAKDESYFENALFVGDSFSDGLREYGHMGEKAAFFATESLTVYNIFDVILTYRSPLETFNASLEGILSGREYKKIYILLGMNEMGVPSTPQYREQYKKVIERIRALQPDAIIYIQGIFHVSEERSKEDPVYNNTAIVQRNQSICTLANGHDIFYIEPSVVYCDKKGNMVASYTNDGVHPIAEHYQLWRQYLNEHVIIRYERDK